MRRRFVSGPDESEQSDWLRGLARGESDHEHEQQDDEQHGDDDESSTIPKAPQGVRTEHPLVAMPDDFLRAMGLAARTGDPSWINRLEPGWVPYR
jgi:hypothetical protein